MDPKANTLNWFEIAVTDMDRAVKFYEAIFQTKLHLNDFGGFKMAVFPSDPAENKVHGGLCIGADYKPSMDGSLIYLNGNPDLQQVVDRIEAAGGKILSPKTQISPEIGFMAMFVDSEGNKMALHSNK